MGQSTRRNMIGSMLMLMLLIAACSPTTPTPTTDVAQVVAAVATTTVPPQATSVPATATTLRVTPTAPTIPTATIAPTATVAPTATTAPEARTPRVGLQVGHWKSNELPEELARLRNNTGAFAAGYSEVDVNLVVTQRVAALLQAQGIIVDVLPATVPPRYNADAFVAIHADGSGSGTKRGFKLATPWRASQASQHLLEAVTAEYGTATNMPQDDAITFNMRGYYAFSWRRFQHSIDRTTPAIIVEMGFLTSAADRTLLVGQPDVPAAGIANGIIRYLNERDPSDTAALLPPNFQTQQPAGSDGATVRAAPSDDARVLFLAPAGSRLIPFQERDGWYQVVVRGNWNVVGWVKRHEVQPSGDPLPTS